MAELGLESSVLLAEYGPDLPVPVLRAGGDEAEEEANDQPPPVPYVRELQQKRLRIAERELNLLGRVNPLALEEFDALEERHRFLSEQLEDRGKTQGSLTSLPRSITGSSSPPRPTPTWRQHSSAYSHDSSRVAKAG
jgi:chromosome segregation protein